MEPYTPAMLPLNSIDWGEHTTLIGKANIALGEYKGVLRGIINPLLLLAPLNLREAIISSRIEGTQTTMEEVMEFTADDSQSVYSERQKNAQEVLNYCTAMGVAIDSLESRPLCINTIRDTHRVLLTSVRGASKNPGEIRTEPNWIGPEGCTIDQAYFVPPEPSLIWDALTNWDDYLHKEDRDSLIQLAILKAQFELIHPFNDGNGRIGRMLVPLILYYKGLLSSPTFYISSYLEQHDKEYRESLRAISRDDDWNGWISFFLKAISEQAKENIDKAQAILDLYNEMKQLIPQIMSTKHHIPIIDTIFSATLINSNYFSERSGIPRTTVVLILQKLTENEILSIYRESSGRRGALYVFPRLLEITK